MPKVEPFAASEVELGWVLRHDGQDQEVSDLRFGPPRGSESSERTLRIFFRSGFSALGEESQTVYRVVTEAEDAQG